MDAPNKVFRAPTVTQRVELLTACLASAASWAISGRQAGAWELWGLGLPQITSKQVATPAVQREGEELTQVPAGCRAPQKVPVEGVVRHCTMWKLRAST